VTGVRALARKILERFRKPDRQSAPQPVPSRGVGDASARPPQFKIDILQTPQPLLKGVARCGYKLDFFTGFGFGPLSIAGKRLLPHAWNIKLSNFLDTTFDRLGLQKLSRAVGDVSIYGFIRTGE
jgi:hypothetical protein